MYCDTGSLGKCTHAWGVRCFFFRIPSIFAINVLLKIGKVHSLTAFYKLFLSHIKDFDKFLAFFDGFSGCTLPLIDTLSFQLMKGVKVV